MRASSLHPNPLLNFSPTGSNRTVNGKESTLRSNTSRSGSPGGTILNGGATNSAISRGQPLLDALANTLEKMPNNPSRPTRTPVVAGNNSSQSARTHNEYPIPPHAHISPIIPPVQPSIHQLPRRQTSATLRRKLQALDQAHLTTGQSTRAGEMDHSGARSVAGRQDLPPSIIPQSAHQYTRVPATNFVAALSQLPQNERQWETLTFPSANPAIETSVSGGVEEVKRLTAWFEQAWIQLEQNVQLDALKAKRAQLRIGTGGQETTEEKGGNIHAELSPEILHQLDLQREKLCFIVFHELLRHVTGACRRRGALLEKIWMHQQRLSEHRIAYRISEIIALSENNSTRAIARMTQHFQNLLREEKATQIKSNVDVTYLSAELEAKERIIQNLQEENDKDLLYSNQIVCHKEMAFLKLERESKLIQTENMKLTEDLKYLSDDKRTLEENLTKIEEEKEELILQTNYLQEIIDAKLRGKQTIETQYDTKDIPPEPSEEEKLSRRSALLIQKVFRGFRMRRKLKIQGLLSRSVILKKLQGLRASGAMSGGHGVGGHHTIAGGMNMLLPLIPKGFSHLMSTIDMEMNRDHFIRLFARKNLLKWIQKLYGEKINQDNMYQRQVKFRKDLSDFVYDYYLIKHGARDAAEMDLLDLFASVEKNIEVSSRVRLFSMFLGNSFRHRKVLSGSGVSDRSSAGSIRGTTKRHHAPEQSHVHLLEHHGPEAVKLHKEHVQAATHHFHHMNEQERQAHDVKCRLSLALNGGRHLSSRVLDFYLLFLTLARKYGHGPFQIVSDNNDGIMWIDLSSIIDLTEKALNRFPAYLLRSTIAKLQTKGSISRTTVLQMGGMQTTASASMSADALQTVASADGGSGVTTTDISQPHRFVDYDTMMEVIVEAYIDEDARCHHMLYDLFLNPNPSAGVNQQRDRKTAAALRKQQLKSPSAAASEGREITTSGSVEGGSHDDDEDRLASGGDDSESSLEPEMFSFVHFCDVIRALGSSWDEDRMLRVYQQSVQRAIHRPVSIEDFVTTLRCYGIMPVEIDADLVEQSAKAKNSVVASEEFLPSLTDDGTAAPEDDALERRHQELKDRMRELEATYTQKIEYSNRRHEKELGQMKQAHERELVILNQAHQQQVELLKRQADHDRSKNAGDFNSLFDSTTQEIAQLKHSLEVRDKREADTISSLNLQFKAKLNDADSTIQFLQNKLSAKSEKYLKKKAALATVQSRLTEVEGMLNRQGGLTSAGGNYLAPEAKTIIEQYKAADEENRQINAALKAELESLKKKYKAIAATSKQLLKATHATAIIQQASAKIGLPDTSTSQSDSLAPPGRTLPDTEGLTHKSLPNSSRASPENENIQDDNAER